MRLFFIFLIPISIFANLSGVIYDDLSQKPIASAKIITADGHTYSDINGTYSFETNATNYHVKAYGYRPYKGSFETNTSALLRPIKVKALYLSFWGASPKTKTFKRMMNIVDNTEVNAVIVDVKNEFGLTSYKTGVSAINAKGAFHQRTIKDIKAFIKIMKAKDIYVIARIVVFKDDLQASAWPQRALKKYDGSIWRNREKLAWINPFDPTSHDIALAVAMDAAKLGFDEINFDYIRFPAYRGIKHTQKNNEKNRTKAIEDFLLHAQTLLEKEGVFISVDTYGQICWASDDTGIGQTVSSLAKYADYLAPMLYPSGFPKGAMGFKDPTQHDYDIIYQSVTRMHDRIAPIRVRPWIQSFKDYAHSHKFYRKEAIRDQINACDDANTNGWLVWNPSSRYGINAYIENKPFLEVTDTVIVVPKKFKKITLKKQAKSCKPLLNKSPYGHYYFNHCQLHDRGVFK